MANRALAIGAGLSLAGLVGGLAYVIRRSEIVGSTHPNVTDPPIPDERWRKIPDKPLADYGKNWGKTPDDLIPYFAALEDISRIPGSARVFSLIAYGESRWVANAHNNDDREVRGSRRSYDRAKATFPRLKYGQEAADFGSGGYFAVLGPIHLWSGARHGFAPLVNLRPESMFDPRYAAFSAIVFMVNLHRTRDVRDIVDVKVGWGRPDRLSASGRQEEAYTQARAKFQVQSVEAQINLEDRTVPGKLDVSNFPGVKHVYERCMSL